MTVYYSIIPMNSYTATAGQGYTIESGTDDDTSVSSANYWNTILLDPKLPIINITPTHPLRDKIQVNPSLACYTKKSTCFEIKSASLQ